MNTKIKHYCECCKISGSCNKYILKTIQKQNIKDVKHIFDILKNTTHVPQLLPNSINKKDIIMENIYSVSIENIPYIKFHNIFINGFTGIYKIHSLNVCHNDLNNRNVLINKNYHTIFIDINDSILFNESYNDNTKNELISNDLIQLFQTFCILRKPKNSIYNFTNIFTNNTLFYFLKFILTRYNYTIFNNIRLFLKKYNVKNHFITNI